MIFLLHCRMLPDVPCQKEKRKGGTTGLAHRECTGKTIFAKDAVQDKHKRDVKYKLPDNGLQHGISPISDSLHAV